MLQIVELKETWTVAENGGIKLVEFFSPMYTTYKVKDLTIHIPAPDSATTGKHSIHLSRNDGDSTHPTGIVSVTSGMGERIEVNNGEALRFNEVQPFTVPENPSSFTQQIKNIVYDDNVGLQVLYKNGTDIALNGDITIRMIVEVV